MDSFVEKQRAAKNTILVIAGPTASGKTAIGILCAMKLDAEIISADSRQIYRRLDIGTAKPTPAQREKITHHFIDEVEPSQIYNAGLFGKEAHDRIGQIIACNKRVIIVGGSGLYIRSIVDGLFEGPSADKEIRLSLEKKAFVGGNKILIDELKKVDPITAEKIDVHNRQRIIRALEVYYIAGIPMSELHKERHPELNCDVIQVGLNWERKKLYERINTRVEEMIQSGFINEVERLMSEGLDAELPVLQTVGYKEAIQYLRIEISYDAMTHLMKQRTRNFAKRQLTWFRKDNRIKWINLNSEDEFIPISNEIVDYFLHSES